MPDEEWGERITAHVVVTDPALTAAALDAMYQECDDVVDCNGPRVSAIVVDLADGRGEYDRLVAPPSDRTSGDVTRRAEDR